MSYQVRPLSFGEILDESFKLLKDHFTVLAGICALLYLPYSVLLALFKPALEPGVPANLVEGLDSALVGLAFLVLFPLTQIAVTRAVSAAYLSTPITIREAYASAKSAYGPYMGTLLLTGLALIGLAILLVVPFIYFSVCWVLVGPVVVIEGLRGREAMRRSRALMKGHWWRTAGVYAVIGIVSGMAAAGVQLVVGAIPVIGPLLSGAVQSIAAAFAEIGLVVLYVDLRCRLEDFDLQRLASQVAGDPPAPPAAVQAARL